MHGGDGTVAFVDGQIVERSTEAADVAWGSVTRWEPPAAVAFRWHPGSAPERASQVEVTFAAPEGGTLVTLEHRGWEGLEDPQDARDEYDRGWPRVLDLYHDRVCDQAGSETWVALVHRPGPRAPRTRGPHGPARRWYDHPSATRWRPVGTSNSARDRRRRQRGQRVLHGRGRPVARHAPGVRSPVSLPHGFDHQHLIQTGDLEQPARHRRQVSYRETAAGRPNVVMD